jgi:hypothetical protein
MIAISDKKTIPLNRQYATANNLPLTVVKGVTGPIPVRIIEAFSSESIQDISPKKW